MENMAKASLMQASRFKAMQRIRYRRFGERTIKCWCVQVEIPSSTPDETTGVVAAKPAEIIKGSRVGQETQKASICAVVCYGARSLILPLGSQFDDSKRYI